MKDYLELVRGEAVSYSVGRMDFAEYFSDDSITDSLVYFASGDGTVFVDKRADEMYAKYAGLHEAICCGKYAFLVPEGDDPEGRCSRIDELVMAIMPSTYRKEYSRKRIEMFKTLIERNLSPALNESFKRSLAFHEAFLAK
ncbi:hypothetical protein IKE98_00530 [Candidatus Saccharibacteria bacterium]|nr:hypothetical protein [Candidatus Saccharibacteria bacterium]